MDTNGHESSEPGSRLLYPSWPSLISNLPLRSCNRGARPSLALHSGFSEPNHNLCFTLASIRVHSWVTHIRTADCALCRIAYPLRKSALVSRVVRAILRSRCLPPASPSGSACKRSTRLRVPPSTDLSALALAEADHRPLIT